MPGRQKSKDSQPVSKCVYPYYVFVTSPPLLFLRGRNYAIAVYEHSVRIYLLVVAALYLAESFLVSRL